MGSDGWLYEVTTAADGTKNYRMTSILPRPEWDGMSFAELGITGSSFRSVTNGTKTTFTLNDFLGTKLGWSGETGSLRILCKVSLLSMMQLLKRYLGL